MGDSKAKATLIFHYVAQPGPDLRAQNRTEEGISPLQSSGLIKHTLCPNCQQHPRTTGLDAAYHLNRGHVW